jgi:excisionase family DNA binding protein
MLERLLTPSDIADRCQVSTKTVLRAIHRGSLRASRLGEHGAYRIREADAERWIEDCVLEVTAPPRAGAPPAGIAEAGRERTARPCARHGPLLKKGSVSAASPYER